MEAPTYAPAPPTLEEFLKTPIGRKVPSITRLIALKLESGDAPEIIARALGTSVEIVNSHIKIIHSFPCRSLDEKLAEEEQEQEDAERAAAVLRRGVATDEPKTREQFQLRMERGLRHERAEGQRKEDDLRAAVTNGNMHAFNKAMPTTPKRDDLMGNAVPFSRIIEIVETRGKQRGSKSAEDENVRSSEIVDKVASTESPDHFSPSQLEHDRSGRDAMSRLLGSSKTAALPPKLRRLAKLWADGMSETDIAKKLRKSQPTVSRMVVEAKDALGIAR